MSINQLDRVLTGRAPIHRDRWGRPIIQNGETRSDGKPRMTTCQQHNDDEPGCRKPIPGVAYRRVTTFIDVIGDRTQLEKWKMRSVAIGILRRPDLLSGVSAALNDGDEPDKTALNDICEQALVAGGATANRDRGKALHKLTERMDAGITLADLEADARADLNAYRAATADLRMVEIETSTVHDEYRVSGTFDRLLEVDGVRYIADIKTGDIDWDTRKVAQQMAMYADGQRYDWGSGMRSHLQVDPEYGLIIHLPQGEARCDLVWVDLNIGREYNALAHRVWAARDEGNDNVRVGPPPALGTLITMAGDLQSLTDLYNANYRRWNDALTWMAKARRQELEAAQ